MYRLQSVVVLMAWGVILLWVLFGPQVIHNGAPVLDTYLPSATTGLPRSSSASPLPTSTGIFTIVVLSYKAPKSLEATLRSLGSMGILSHPELGEVLVYFQARVASDEALVRRVFSEARTANAAPLSVRVLGDGSNLPVAEATFRALTEVRSRYVLYLECDRPVFPYRDRAAAVTQINTAIRFLDAGVADVFRLQLYSNSALLTDGANSVLSRNMYGEDTEQHCRDAPTYSQSTCQRAKRDKGRSVFHTAYCKHWKKFNSSAPQQDLCDAFCFAHWVTTDDDAVRSVRRRNREKLARVSFHADDAPGHSQGSNASSSADVICMTSAECNWTNQPTMYAREWYEKNIVLPCRSDKAGCVGVPGRRSAVLQEQFFNRRRDVWAQRRHKVCLHRYGAFFHNEIDNREGGSRR